MTKTLMTTLATALTITSFCHAAVPPQCTYIESCAKDMTKCRQSYNRACTNGANLHMCSFLKNCLDSGNERNCRYWELEQSDMCGEWYGGGRNAAIAATRAAPVAASTAAPDAAARAAPVAASTAAPDAAARAAPVAAAKTTRPLSPKPQACTWIENCAKDMTNCKKSYDASCSNGSEYAVCPFLKACLDSGNERNCRYWELEQSAICWEWYPGRTSATAAPAATSTRAIKPNVFAKARRLNQCVGKGGGCWDDSHCCDDLKCHSGWCA